MTHERKFGKITVSISDKGEIAIAGDTNSNFGRIYSHAIDRFKAHAIGEESDWNRPQVIGMAWEYGIASKNSVILKWIYSKILKGKFDHLINN